MRENVTQQSAGGRATNFSGEGSFEWMADSVCAQTDPEAFFPEGSNSPLDAKITCALCTVAEQCLAFALQSEDQFGLAGGLSHRERRKYKNVDLSDNDIHEIVEKVRAATVAEARKKGRTVLLAASSSNPV